jgi:UDP-N-acetylmuramyl pentapeptide phosphotransferase/UDP-N-acetylglucosamine-1-phosphate transferase
MAIGDVSILTPKINDIDIQVLNRIKIYMLIYLISATVLIAILLLYFRVAYYFNIIDKPNHRSSHSAVTIRGGGIIFPFAALLWFLFFGLKSPWAITGLGLMAIVSFLDDMKTLSSKIRIIAHLTAVSLLFWQVQLYSLPLIFVAGAYLFTIGWVNAFNFMDGINGITAFYSTVALSTFLWMNNTLPFAPAELIILLIISAVIFSFFNARKRAKTFAGDVGSVTMAYLLAWLMISLMLKTGRIEYILFFAVYGIDTVVTIIYRLKRRENIFEAHRLHLFQFLSNELRWPHVGVSLLFAITQLVINLVTIWLFSVGMMTLPVFAGFLLLLTILYLFIRYSIETKIKENQRS